MVIGGMFACHNGALIIGLHRSKHACSTWLPFADLLSLEQINYYWDET